MPGPGVNLSSHVHLILRNRNFRRLWPAGIINQNGDRCYTLAIYSLLLNLTAKLRRWDVSLFLGPNLAISILVLAVATSAGWAIDRGYSPQTIATGTGLAMLLAVGIWAFALRLWRSDSRG
jgi:hypothetical protein